MVETMIIDRIKKTSLIGIYLNKNDTSRFLVGKVMASDDLYMIFSMISVDGKDAGKALINLNFPYRIEYETNYLNQFIPYNKEQTIVFKEPLFESYICYAIKKSKLLKFKDYDNRIIMYGIVLKQTSNGLEVQRYTKNGKRCNLYRIQKNRIAFIEFDSLEELDIEKLVYLEKRL